MLNDYHPLTYRLLAVGKVLGRNDVADRQEITLDTPAVAAMTGFKYVRPFRAYP